MSLSLTSSPEFRPWSLSIIEVQVQHLRTCARMRDNIYPYSLPLKDQRPYLAAKGPSAVHAVCEEPHMVTFTPPL
jgi:hypothetical protein